MLCGLATLMAVSWGVGAATLTVSNLADAGPGTLRQAVNDAAAGDTIEFAVTGTIALSSGAIQVDKNLEIQGPGASSLTISGGNTNRLFNNSARLVIKALTLSDGYANSGGGIYNTGELTLLHTHMHNNYTDTLGGIGGGGAIYNQGRLVIQQSRLEGNTAVGTSQSNGGGAIFNYGVDSSVTVSRSLVAGNAVVGEYICGGGIFNAFGELKVLASTVEYNSTDLYGYGGGIYTEGGSMTISGSTISNNNTSWDGGGLYNYSTDGSIINSTFSGNTADTGGGIYHGEFFAPSTTAIRIQHTTITDNSANGTGGFHYTFSGAILFQRNLVAQNNGGAPDCFGIIPSSGYNLVGDANGCDLLPTASDIIGAAGSPINPLLGLLQGNGGPTETHALLAGSPALDQVPGPVCTDPIYFTGVNRDQRGYNRPAGEGCDIGAYESSGAARAEP